MRADLERWNERYGGEFEASFLPHPLAERALALPLPAGPVLDLASGPSGTVLLAAGSGRRSVAVDISDVALSLLRARVRAQPPAGPVAIVQADLDTWRPRPATFALVVCTGYWDSALFAAAARAVLPGGLLGWESLTTEALRLRPGMPATWCVRPGEPASLLPAGYRVLCEEDLPADGPPARRRLLARAGQDAVPG
ncbi:MAG TPA: class I SAM-dependent methyltransferase [Streptosporangiaceae bacterium]